MSLPEIEEICYELLLALSAVHDSGWIWLGLKQGHILFNLYKLDPRNPTCPLRIIEFENAMQIGSGGYAVLPFDLKIMDSLKQRAPECAPGANITTAVDMHAVGMYLKSLLHRCQSKVWENSEGLSQDERAAILRNFNICVYDESKQISDDNKLLDLIEMLLKDDPAERPTAKDALRKLQQWKSYQHMEDLQLGTVSEEDIPGYLDPVTGRFVWPVLVQNTVVEDCRVPNRLTTYVLVMCAVDTPRKKRVAIFSGRPAPKKFLMFLKYLGLHTHALNDGSLMGYDGRRLCNGIFDKLFYIKTKKVISF